MKSMKSFTFTILIAILLISAGCKSNVAGEVFVVTKGAGSYKLGDVEVSAISEKDLKSRLVAEKDSFKTALNEWKQSLTTPCTVGKSKECYELIEQRQFQLADFLFTIPAAASATTNADGKFSLTLPSGSYYLLAKGQRMTGKDTEYYLWLHKIIANGKEQTVMLSNNNLSGVGNIEALINLTQ